jgi:hypothetical protein
VVASFSIAINITPTCGLVEPMCIGIFNLLCSWIKVVATISRSESLFDSIVRRCVNDVLVEKLDRLAKVHMRMIKMGIYVLVDLI